MVLSNEGHVTYAIYIITNIFNSYFVPSAVLILIYIYRMRIRIFIISVQIYKVIFLFSFSFSEADNLLSQYL